VTSRGDEHQFTAESVAGEFGVSACTVKRDFELMRDRAARPTCEMPHRYTCTHHHELLPLLRSSVYFAGFRGDIRPDC
jgi:hypothetical protein